LGAGAGAGVSLLHCVSEFYSIKGERDLLGRHDTRLHARSHSGRCGDGHVHSGHGTHSLARRRRAQVRERHGVAVEHGRGSTELR
jgi:hypothetical protein